MSDRLHRTGRPPRVVVIGVGNRYRGDDGVGHRVIDRLSEDVAEAQAQAGHPSRPPTGRLERTELCYSDGEPSRLLDQWDGADLAIVVDAVATGSSASSTAERRVMLPVCQCSSWRPVISTSG